MVIERIAGFLRLLLRISPPAAPSHKAPMVSSSLQDDVERLASELLDRYNAAAPRLTYNNSLPHGPHSSNAHIPLPDARSILSAVALDGLTPLDGINLHACFPSAATSEALKLLTTNGLGRTMRDRGGLSQSQYLIDLADPIAFTTFSSLESSQPAIRALRRIMRAVVEAPGVGSIPGVMDALPVAGVANERHFWMRLSQPGGFNTNGNSSSGCWHIDNPHSPTIHRSSRLILKLYAASDGDVHVLQVRSAALCIEMEADVKPGDGIIMSDYARGSSQEGTRPFAIQSTAANARIINGSSSYC